MKQEIFEKFITTMYPDIKYSLLEYEVLKRYMLNESNEFVNDTPSIRISIKIHNGEIDENDLTDMFESFTGFGLIIDNF